MSNLRFPLIRWRVRNLKSIANAEVDIAGLTITVGPNSSGKSTLLQSILAAAQAARSDEYEVAFPLNGPLVDLGDFNDAHHHSSSGAASYITLGGTFSPVVLQEDLHAGAEPPVRMRMRQMALAWTPTELTWEVNLSASNEEEMLGAARVESIDFAGPIFREDPEEPTGHFRFTATAAEATLNNDPSRAVMAKGGLLMVNGRLDTADGEPTAVVGLTHQGGIPRQFFGDRERVRIVLENFLRAWPVGGRRGRTRAAEATIAQAKEALIQLLCNRFAAERERRIPPVAVDARGWRTEHPEAAYAFDEPAEQELIVKEVIRRTGVEERAIAPFRSRDVGLDAALGCAELLSRFFARRVLYLGPLREEPRAAYKPGVADQQTPVGKRGELTAYVLRRYGRRKIVAPRHDKDESRISMPLTDAVAYWMRYLGAADQVSATGQSRYGIGLRVRPTDLRRDLDLTAVGVGVSQVLPVVVLALFAEPGSIVLFEQPELHLHPATQQRLADFFIACVRTGRQLLIETHSDHLISRLRLRIAEDESDELRSDTSILFAERSSGTTTYRRVVPTQYGTIEEWPEGFFDQAARESQAILRAGAEKKKRERQEALQHPE